MKELSKEEIEKILNIPLLKVSLKHEDNLHDAIIHALERQYIMGGIDIITGKS